MGNNTAVMSDLRNGSGEHSHEQCIVAAFAAFVAMLSTAPHDGSNLLELADSILKLAELWSNPSLPERVKQIMKDSASTNEYKILDHTIQQLYALAAMWPAKDMVAVVHCAHMLKHLVNIVDAMQQQEAAAKAKAEQEAVAAQKHGSESDSESESESDSESESESESDSDSERIVSVTDMRAD